MVTDAQVRRLMKELTRTGKVGVAAMRSDMDRKTAAKYRDSGILPSQAKEPRSWRTRNNPFEAVWPLIVTMLVAAPELQAKTIFDHLCREDPGGYQENQLRTLQRQVRQWRAESGPPKEVFFPQEHRPGEAAQTDFTWANKLGITIEGEPFEHMLCHFVLPYSNWEWATVCHSESMLSLRRGLQGALFQLGCVPTYSQTDNSTAATHTYKQGGPKFNDDYLALMRHFNMKPRTISVGKSEQNGDVEASNGALKNRLKQHLLLRGSSDFGSVDEYTQWMEGIVRLANQLRSKRLADELKLMRPVPPKALPEFNEEVVKVTSYSTIRIVNNAYSVPSRLIGESLKVRVYEDRLEISFGKKLQGVVRRLRGEGGHSINYRHIISWLVRKPGAFERYRYREDLFPTLAFRKAYDTLVESHVTLRKAEIEYLRILELAASTLESDVETALSLLASEKNVVSAAAVKDIVLESTPVAIPELTIPEVDLTVFDDLLVQEVAA